MKNLLLILKWSVLVVALAGAVGMLAGCSTINGVGQDVEHVGERIQQEFN